MSRYVGAEEKLELSFRSGNSGTGAQGQFVRAHPFARPTTTLRDKRRSAMVEYALVIAVFCAILFAIVAFARALHAYHFADNAAHGAAPYALVRGAPRQG